MKTGRTDGSTWRVVELDDRAGWDAALDGVSHGLAHTWAYNVAMQASTRDQTMLFVTETGTERFVCPIAERGPEEGLDVYTPLGFSGVVGHGDVGAYRQSWAAFVGQKGYVAGYLGLHPVLAPDALVSAPDASTGNAVYMLDLVDEPDALLRRMSESTRRRLRRWPDADEVITTDRDVLTATFLRLYAPFMELRGASRVYALTEDTLQSLCRVPGVTLYGTPAQIPRAVVMLGSSTRGAEYVYGVADPEARHSIASLLWRAIRDSAEQGKEWLNLGGGIQPHDSLAEFKRRLGGRAVPLTSLKQIYDQERFQMLCDKAGVGANDAFFPPYRGPRVSEGRDEA